MFLSVGEGVFWVFCMVSDSNKCRRVKPKTEYKRIHKYHKSVKKKKEEQERWKRVLELWDKGLTIKQIIVLLGVSERTVERDLVKARRFLLGRQKQQLNELSDAEWRNFLGSFKV